MFEPAERLKNVKVSASAAMTRKVRELRAQGVKIVGLSSGEPDFKSPPNAIEAAHQAALAGDTKYPPQDGTVLGAAGGSGGTGDEDEAVCIAGIEAAGLAWG